MSVLARIILRKLVLLMALPMVHLVAARMWAQDKPAYINCPEYYLGTISPDAIHIRDGNDKSHKDEIHLRNWRVPNPGRVAEYWRTHRTPFDAGYGLHVLLDGQWAVGFRSAFPEMLLPSGKPDPEIYYNDTYRLDFALFDQYTKDGFFEDMLKQAVAPLDHPLLTAYEISAWRDETFRFYDRPCPKNDPIRFITREYLDHFLGECFALPNELYKEAFL